MIEENQFNKADFIKYILDYFQPNKTQPTHEEKTDSNIKLERKRLIKECVDYLKKEDPETKITANQIRVLVNSGKVPANKFGNKILVNLDKLIEYLNTSTLEQKEEVRTGGIRRVDL